jgi:predicted nicotinamide N-methyase
MHEAARRFLALGYPEINSLEDLEVFCDEVLAYDIGFLPKQFATRCIRSLSKLSFVTASAESKLCEIYAIMETSSRGICYSQFRVNDTKSVRIAFDEDTDCDHLVKSGSTGFKIWEAAKILATYLMKHSQLLSGASKILELGAGTGFVSLSLASIYQDKIFIATDCHAGVLANLEKSLCYSDLKNNCKVSRLDWFDFDSQDFEYDLIIGADIVYDPDLIDPLVAALHRLLKKKDTEAILCCSVRNEDNLNRFKERLQNKGLKVECLIQGVSTEMIDSKFIQGNEISMDVVIIRVIYIRS